MWKWYPESSRRIIYYAQQEAQGNGELFVASEDILLGLLREQDNTGLRALQSLGIEPGDLRAAILRCKTAPKQASQGEMNLAMDAKRVVRSALRESRSHGSTEIGPEYLLLGLVTDEHNLASRILAGYGLTRSMLRSAIQDIKAETENSVTVWPPPIQRHIADDLITQLKAEQLRNKPEPFIKERKPLSGINALGMWIRRALQNKGA